MSQATATTPELFADQRVDLLPERTTMYHFGHHGCGGGGHGTRGLLTALLQQLRSANGVSQSGNVVIVVAINAGNTNVSGTQINSATAVAIVGGTAVTAGA
jgi:hypothetical protein